jgi:hypothetical protein
MQGICCDCQRVVLVIEKNNAVVTAEHKFAVQDRPGIWREYTIICEGSGTHPQCLVKDENATNKS